MKKKGLVYRATTLLGLSIIFLQFGGEVFYAKYFRDDRDDSIKQEREEEERKDKFEKEDLELEQIEKQGGFFASWRDKRKARLEKIKQAKERPAAPLLEELKEKPGIKEIRMRKLVEKRDSSDNLAKEASRDDYI